MDYRKTVLIIPEKLPGFLWKAYRPFTLLCVSFLNTSFLNLKIRFQVKVILLKIDFQMKK